MVERILDFISQLSPLWIYIVVFVASYLENVFPPSPSDFVIVVAGSLVGIGSLHFIPTLLLATVGSVLGFMTLFYVGTLMDKRIVRSGKIKFISVKSIENIEHWFQKYGYWIILSNRFLPGARSVISFFGGLSELKKIKTALLAFLSALVWNSVMIYLGLMFGSNVQSVDYYLSTYSYLVYLICAALLIFFIFRFFLRKKNS
jgi:membrane protein DedA with SNARE-associated domain